MATNTTTAARESTAAAAGTETRTAVQKLREQADAVVERIQPQITAVSTFVREEPTKALLISAAAGAALMGLFALIVRSSGRSQVPGASAGRSAIAAIRDAALDLADSAQAMALDALEATQKRAADALDATQKRAAEALGSTQKRAADALDATQKRASAAADSVTESVADTWKKVRDQAAPVVEKIKPQIDAAAAYAKEEPARTALGLAAAGAIIAGLIALARRSEDDSLS
jgi:ElaB/YqjD/DUF883 family membrane-anchored ribosome-binding protein